jgi:formate dehydrogenase iron-sulfur subunit
MSGLSYDNTQRLDGTTWRRVKFIEQFPRPYNGRWLMMSDVCKHCVQAPCLECVDRRDHRTEFDTVVIQSDTCNGCRDCIAACPFGVIDINRVGNGAEVRACYDRTSVGLRPPVPSRVPLTHQFGPISELRQRRAATGRAAAGAG